VGGLGQPWFARTRTIQQATDQFSLFDEHQSAKLGFVRRHLTANSTPQSGMGSVYSSCFPLSTDSENLDIQSITVRGQRYLVSTADLQQKSDTGIGMNKHMADAVGGAA
jgi:hypothetical protein